MKNQSIAILIFTLIGFSSCKSLQKLVNKDQTIGKVQTLPNKTQKQREFINGIVVTPSFQTVSKPTKVANSKTTNNPIESSQNQSFEKVTGTYTLSSTATQLLQIKYAILTDATLEKLSNIPLLQLIDKWWATKYCYGGVSENCVDCSGFVQIVMKEIYKKTLPRTSQEQFHYSESIEADELREGDLVFFNTNGRDVSHVGIYLLNNKFLHASTSLGVTISDLHEKYWQPKFVRAGRIQKNE